VLLHGFHPLPDGRRVRLRLPHTLDRAELHELLREHGLTADEIDVRRALRCVPRRRLALCAVEWAGSSERLVGFGALEAGAVTLIGAPTVAALLREQLGEHAQSWSRRVA
jgi:hypothetical protein